MDLYHKGVTHFQHGALLKQDVNVARVSSWIVADSMKRAPGIFEDNDPELVKKLKETLSQSGKGAGGVWITPTSGASTVASRLLVVTGASSPATISFFRAI